MLSSLTWVCISPHCFCVTRRTLEELAKEQKRIAAKRASEKPESIATEQEQSAESMLEFLDRARNGEMMPPDVIVQYANFFQDDLTLDNMPRMQLLNMCKYMSIPPYGSDSFLRFQLRHKIRILKDDDQRILWEGIDSLTKMELREACQERGMRSTGLSKEAYKRSLQQWLDLSVNKNVPISLLIMSRIFFLQEEIVTPTVGDETKSVASLADAISGMDKEVLNEVILEVATSEEKKSNPDVRKIKLEVLTHQNEKIKEEQEEREAAAKKKETSEKEKEKDTSEKVEIQTADGTDIVVEVVDVKSEIPATTVSISEAEPSVAEETVGETAAEKDDSSDEKADKELSAEEMEAISQLLSADPVSKEREELEKIKSAITEEEEPDLTEEEEATAGEAETSSLEPSGIESAKAPETDEEAAAAIEKLEKEAALEAEKSTVFSTDSEIPMEPTQKDEDLAVGPDASSEVAPEDVESEEEEDIVVARLKQRLASMVDKIEVQLSDVQVKIGDKLHFLDKDMDGILSREEMADVLQQVLKREITHEEAMEIASEMVSFFTPIEGMTLSMAHILWFAPLRTRTKMAFSLSRSW